MDPKQSEIPSFKQHDVLGIDPRIIVRLGDGSVYGNHMLALLQLLDIVSTEGHHNSNVQRTQRDVGSQEAETSRSEGK